MLTALARDQLSQPCQDRLSQNFHLVHQQEVDLSIQKWWYRDTVVVRTIRVLLLLYSQSLLTKQVETLGSKSGKDRQLEGASDGPTLDERN